MTAKEYLGQIKELQNEIDDKLIEIFRLDSLIGSIKSSAPTEDRVQTSMKSDKLEASVILLMEEKEAAYNLIRKYTVKKNRITKQIDKLSDLRYKRVLKLHYVENCSLNVISKKMDYSYKQITRIHGEALQVFQKKYLDN